MKIFKTKSERSPAVAWKCSTAHCRLLKFSASESIICRHCADCAK